MKSVFCNISTFLFFILLSLQSLNSRNKALMKDKKRLLVINKLEIDRLEKEKVCIASTMAKGNGCRNLCCVARGDLFRICQS